MASQSCCSLFVHTQIPRDERMSRREELSAPREHGTEKCGSDLKAVQGLYCKKIKKINDKNYKA